MLWWPVPIISYALTPLRFRIVMVAKHSILPAQSEEPVMPWRHMEGVRMTAKKILNRRSMRLASGGGAVPGGRIDELSAAMMLNVAGEIIMAQDGSGTITLMNESGHWILGYEYPELLGRNWFDVRLPEETRPELRALFERLKLRPTDEVVMHEDALLNRRGERK